MDNNILKGVYDPMHNTYNESAMPKGYRHPADEYTDRGDIYKHEPIYDINDEWKGKPIKNMDDLRAYEEAQSKYVDKVREEYDNKYPEQHRLGIEDMSEDMLQHAPIGTKNFIRQLNRDTYNKEYLNDKKTSDELYGGDVHKNWHQDYKDYEDMDDYYNYMDKLHPNFYDDFTKKQDYWDEYYFDVYDRHRPEGYWTDAAVRDKWEKDMEKYYRDWYDPYLNDTINYLNEKHPDWINQPGAYGYNNRPDSMFTSYSSNKGIHYR